MYFSRSKLLILALAFVSTNGQSCSDSCTIQGSCGSGNIQVCHAGEEDECLDESEWSEHCNDFGDTCGACSSDSGSSSAACFSATSTLLVQGKGPVSMADAQIGDMVMTSPGSYEPLYAFGHYKVDVTAEFLKIKTSVDSLEITKEHLLHVVGHDAPIRADAVKVGDSLISLEGTATPVQKISTITNKGLYAPLTPSGKVVVNNVVASAYIALTDADSESITVGPMSMSHESFVHLTLAPFRVFCMGVTDKPCQVYNEEGIAVYVGWGKNIVNAAHDDGAFWGYLGLIIGMPIATTLLAIEWVVGPYLTMMAACLLGLAASKYSNKKKIKTV